MISGVRASLPLKRRQLNNALLYPAVHANDTRIYWYNTVLLCKRIGVNHFTARVLMHSQSVKIRRIRTEIRINAR